MTYPCTKCGFDMEWRAEECPRCTAIKAKYPDLVEYIDACAEKAEENGADANWQRDMGDDL